MNCTGFTERVEELLSRGAVDVDELGQDGLSLS